MELYATKRPNGFQPTGGLNKEAFDKLANGQIYKLKVTKDRSKGFHRKVLSMLRFAFDFWEPKAENMPEGVLVEKDFEKFRKQLTIRAGYYKQTFNLDGTFDLEAESIAFDQMDEIRFGELFSAFVDAILQSNDIIPVDESNARFFREQIVNYL